MCGIVGYLHRDAGHHVLAGKAQDLAGRMAEAIVHRGPDDAGVWFDKRVGLALAHRRLAILDLSPAGHQPMFSPSGRYVMVFNGEIYNHLTLRKQLVVLGEQSVEWRGHSDTETLLACVDAWGVEAALKKTIGMFAIALWDRKKRELYLARDRMGEKPLYYGWQKGVFMFASELKALKAHPAFAGEVDRDVLSLFLRHNYIPTPYSIYKGIRKLLPGSFLKLRVGGDQLDVGMLPTPVAYWSSSDIVAAGQCTPFNGSDTEAVVALDKLLAEAVRHQMLADVPLGAFLSGGIDSSIVVALMQSQSDRPVKTFTIGFNEENYNEAKYAKDVARHLGTEHTELYVSSKDAMEVIPRLPLLFDEPFSDSSQIPTFLVSEMTRRYVTVSLSGDGGDELFGGYNRYFLGRSIWNKIGWMPESLRKCAASLLRFFSPQEWDRLYGAVSPIISQKISLNMPGDRLHKLASILAVASPEQMYHRLVSHWSRPDLVVQGGHEPLTILTDKSSWPEQLDFTERMMFLDMMTYLPDDILVKVDRAAMGVSLETRVPFLDHRVVEFAWSLPLSLKIRGGQGKWLLRQVLYGYVPRRMIERPKMGFGVPIDAWLRGPLRDWAESLLSESSLQQQGYFNPATIRQKWQEHLSGQRNWQYHLWDILMFQAWNGSQ